MTNATITLEVDSYSNIFIQEEGSKNVPVVSHSVYGKNCDESFILHETELSDLLDEFIADNIVPDGTATQKQREELIKSLEIMQHIIEEKIDFVQNIREWQKPE